MLSRIFTAALTKLFSTLVQFIRPFPMTDDLFAQGVIRLEHMEEVSPPKTRNEAARFLVTLMFSVTDQQFTVFMEILTDHYEDLAIELNKAIQYYTDNPNLIPTTCEGLVARLPGSDYATAAEPRLPGSDVPKNRPNYVTATERMLAAEGKMGRYGPTLLCTDNGAVEWGPPADRWTEWVRGGWTLYLPDIILPVSLREGKVGMYLDKYCRVVKLRTWIESDAYNERTKLPIKATIKFSMTDSTTMKKCDGQGDVNWEERGVVISVCDLDRDVVQKMKSPIMKVFFMKPSDDLELT